MQYTNPNMLLRIAQGDAFAAAVEYVNRDKHQDLFSAVDRFDSYQQHPTHLKLKPGMYTDDAQMSIGVAEVLCEFISSKRIPTASDFRAKFFECFKRDERDGYSRGFQAILESSSTLIEFEQKIVPASNKNGAAMRSVPLGVIQDKEVLELMATIQASVTHRTHGGFDSSCAVALMSHFALYESAPLSEVNVWLNDHGRFFPFEQPWTGAVKAQNDRFNLGVGMVTAHAVNTLLATETSLKGIMRRLIKWGGDTDSVAAIAWGIASARYQDEELPEFLERDLEPGGGGYGVQFLKELGAKLMNLQFA